MNNSSTIRNLMIAIVAVLVIGFGYMVMNQPDNRSVGQKISDAADELPNMDKAGRQLEDRTPADKIGDAVKDATH
ncbi:MAG: hypothetical protein JWO78_1502 [Micavibrio sp.]|nr:hypothetical protein [Micavibrio sp.]